MGQREGSAELGGVWVRPDVSTDALRNLSSNTISTHAIDRAMSDY